MKCENISQTVSDQNEYQVSFQTHATDLRHYFGNKFVSGNSKMSNIVQKSLFQSLED